MKEAKKPRVDLVFPNQENLDSLFLEIDLLNFEILRRITSSNDKMLKIVTTNCWENLFSPNQKIVIFELNWDRMIERNKDKMTRGRKF